ncbi:MAG TPA: hypothetical protein DEQ32_17950, partial [Gammaproteobacteria bacterium]|nr:hypothetical protein [Gammaproteobacteria bacterium]
FAERATFILQRIEKLTNIIIFGLGFCLALAGSVLWRPCLFRAVMRKHLLLEHSNKINIA